MRGSDERIEKLRYSNGERKNENEKLFWPCYDNNGLSVTNYRHRRLLPNPWVFNNQISYRPSSSSSSSFNVRFDNRVPTKAGVVQYTSIDPSGNRIVYSTFRCVNRGVLPTVSAMSVIDDNKILSLSIGPAYRCWW